MPASLPGNNRADNLANPNAGLPVTFDPLSGPKGSPLDVRKIAAWAAGSPVYANDAANQTPSTGALSTGIGFGLGRVINVSRDIAPSLPAYAIFRAGYSDDMIPGQVQTFAAPPPPGNVASNVVGSRMMYIGGGRMIKNTGVLAADQGRPFIPSPFTAGVSIAAAGNGGSRDAGAGPAFTGFEMKMVTAAGAVANGAAIEGAFINRSGVALAATQSVFGSSNVAIAAPV